MADLITQVELAEVGSRHLDFEIACVVYGKDEANTVRLPEGSPLPAFSTSLDAALHLVPEGWGWAAAELDKGVYSAVVTNREPQLKPGTFDPNPNKIDFRTKAATTALALCLAALKARQRKVAEGSEGE